MLGIIGVLGNIGLLLGGQVAARFGMKVAVIAAVLAVFATIWTAAMALVSGAIALIPASPLSAFAFGLLPSSAVISAGIGLVFTTMTVLKALDWWKQSFSVAAGIAAM